MMLINEAWEILKDPETRATYDKNRSSSASPEDIRKANENSNHAKQKAQNYPRKWDDFVVWALVSSSWTLETSQYKKFNKASEFEASPPKLTLFQEYRERQQELF